VRTVVTCVAENRSRRDGRQQGADLYCSGQCAFSACASLALPGGHAKGRPGPWGAVSPTTHTVATRAPAAAPVGGGGGLGREELPLPPRVCAAAGCSATPPPMHAVTDHRVSGVGARPQGISSVRRAGGPCSGGAVEVGPPPGGGMAPQLPHARRGGEAGWGC